MIVRRYHSQLTAYGRAWGWDEHVVKDALQITWMKFFNLAREAEAGRSGGLIDPGNLRAWLARTLRNALHDEHRRDRRQERLAARAEESMSTSQMVSEPDFLEAVEREERHSLLRSAFSRLGQTCRELLGLMLVDPPLSYADVAELMGKPVGSIGPTRQRCIDTVQAIMAEPT
jgi:RNA polymerase sigma factor (sigma-70 family)